MNIKRTAAHGVTGSWGTGESLSVSGHDFVVAAVSELKRDEAEMSLTDMKLN